MNYIELAKQANGEPAWTGGVDWTWEELAKFADLVAAHERDFIATKWENLYGYDKQGVAEFVRKRANTQEETT